MFLGLSRSLLVRIAGWRVPDTSSLWILLLLLQGGNPNDGSRDVFVNEGGFAYFCDNLPWPGNTNVSRGLLHVVFSFFAI